VRVKVQVFARLREIAGGSDWSCEVAPGAVVADVWRASVATRPALAAFTGAVTCAVNNEFARKDSSVADGDTIAFLPPVSGGAW
jgi:molybdopterin converting factor subunit 1